MVWLTGAPLTKPFLGVKLRVPWSLTATVPSGLNLLTVVTDRFVAHYRLSEPAQSMYPPNTVTVFDRLGGGRAAEIRIWREIKRAIGVDSDVAVRGRGRKYVERITIRVRTVIRYIGDDRRVRIWLCRIGVYNWPIDFPHPQILLKSPRISRPLHC